MSWNFTLERFYDDRGKNNNNEHETDMKQQRDRLKGAAMKNLRILSDESKVERLEYKT